MNYILWPVPSAIYQNEQRQFFCWIFGVKNIDLTNFKHYSPVWGDFWGFKTIFFGFLKIFFILHIFEKCNINNLIALLFDIQTP